MAELTVPRVDFSSLGELPALWKKGQNEQKLADLGRGLADGTIDYKTAAAQTAGMGDITHTLQFLALAEARKKQEDELAASNQFRQGLQGMYGAQPGPGVPMPSAIPVPGARPREAIGGSDAIPSVAPRAPIPSTSKVWGDAEAEAAGLYEPTKPTTLAALPVAPVRAGPAAPAAPTSAGLPTGVTPRALQLIEASSSPRLPQAQRELAKTLLASELDAGKATPDMKEWAFAKSQDPNTPDYTTWVRANKAAGKTEINIDQKGESEFEKEMSKGQAKRWNGYIAEGQAAERKLVDINTMREIHRRMGSQGAAANIKEAIGPYAEALGINIGGLSDIQAYSQVIQRLAPQQRAEGSGSTSDIEFKGFLKSLPTLSQNPAAREIGLNTMEALTRDEMARGEIASRLATREITRKDAERQLRALPDPMQGFVEWRKANPELYGQALKGNAPPAGAPSSFEDRFNAARPGQTKAPIRVASPAEARKLPSGTEILLPDGTVGRVP
ncbi:hypothetical protein [Bradyrhizobium icense]|uniref:Uncharacterized protein n=1 Tax=Bradyrhizobium icense TaxID=1274631 RepID=A0A1B1UD49_9BRAD|nr:hypothetical protein [Bradyrhizobium icense]ANW00687.1 hypothetical protein LMTR13_11410 [Bradyrhizobium icense]